MNISAPEALGRADRVICVGVRRVPHRAGAMLFESQDPEEINRWTEATVRDLNTRVALVMAAAWYEQNRDAGDRIIRDLEQRIHHAKINQASVQQMSEIMARNFLVNLPQLGRYPVVSSLAGCMTGKPAVIVSAGPSLDRNKHLLEAIFPKAVVLAVNTSAKAVPGPLDGIVSVEHKDVTKLFDTRAPDTTLFLDITASPAAWELPSPHKVALVNQNPPLMPYMVDLKAAPIAYKGGVAGAALCTAHYLGASPIILVGQDLAWTDNRCYAAETPFDDLSVTREGDGVLHSGESKLIHSEHALDVEAWGGNGTVLSSHVWEGFRLWFSETTEVLELINCTEGGSRIHGAREATLQEMIDELPDIERPDFKGGGSDQYQCVLDKLRQDATKILAAEDDDLPQVCRDVSLVQMWVVPAILRMDQTSMSPDERAKWIRDAQRKAGQEILNAVGDS